MFILIFLTLLVRYNIVTVSLRPDNIIIGIYIIHIYNINCRSIIKHQRTYINYKKMFLSFRLYLYLQALSIQNKINKIYVYIKTLAIIHQFADYT